MYRVLVIGLLYGYNGVNISALNLYRHMDRSLIQYDFLIRTKYLQKRFQPRHEQMIEEILDLGGNVHYLNYSRADIPKRSRPALRELLATNSDIMGVHVHDLSLNIHPLLVADKLAKPIKVIQQHAGFARSELDERVRAASHKQKVRATLISGEQFDRLACSDFAGRAGYLNYSFEIFPNACDLERFQYNSVYRKVLRMRLSIPEDAVVLGSIGSIYDVKNPMFSVKIFEEYLKINPNTYLVFVGSGAQAEEIDTYFKKQGLKDKTRIVASLAQVEMFYSMFDVMLCPSKQEGMPNTLVEAQATGLPCLISDEITRRALLTPVAHMMSLDESPVYWAAKIVPLLNNYERRSMAKELKAAGYDIEDAAARLVELYLKRIEEAAKAKQQKGNTQK